MSGKAASRRLSIQSGPTPSRMAGGLTIVAIVAVLSWGSTTAYQAVKAAVVSSSFESTTFRQWSHDLGYRGAQIFPLGLESTGCPFIEAEVSGVKVHLMLDTGTARGFVITDHAPAVPHRVEKRGEELMADGSHRGESASILVDTLTILGEVFKNVGGTLADWRMFASEPFDGTVGLEFFANRRMTLDYRARKVAVADSPVPEKLDPKRYLFINLVEPPKSQGHILYARAKVNGRQALVYLDTGYNVSFVDPAFAEGLTRVERPGKFRVFRQRVPMELGGAIFILDDLRESEIRRGTGFDLPVALTLGSDILSRFVVTVDIRARKLILAVAE